MPVGDEYLITLQDTIPVSAEVIKDEDATIQKGAKRFVKGMETFTSESIIDQIK